MAGLLHGCARTTPCVRAELQASQASTRALAARYGLNPKTVAKWRERSDTADAPMGPRRPRSTVLTEAEEAAVVEFRRRTLLPLDDVLGCLRESIPRLTRSALHRCLERHGISRLPRDEDGLLQAQALRRDQDRLRPCRQLRAARRRGQGPHVPCHRSCLQVRLRRAARNRGDGYGRCLHARGRGRFPLPHPYRADRQRRRLHPLRRQQVGQDGPSLRPRLRRARHQAQAHQALPSLDQRPGRADEPDGEGGHRQDIPLRDLGSFKAHLQTFLAADNFAKHLKALRWRTPFQAVCDAWKNDPTSFTINPHHLIPGPNT